MLNVNRIVPVTFTDLITLYAVILKQSNATLNIEGVTGGPAVFDIDELAAPTLLNEPAHTINVATWSNGGELYFVPAYDYETITVDGAAVTINGLVDPDGCTLYKATYADGAITVNAVAGA